ncbi:MAG: hypothetical protein ABSE28_18570 [Candidatus Sulfotelmatobacter sp.]
MLGLEVMQRYGDGAVFRQPASYHHHIALNTWKSLGGSPPGTTGLCHTAIVYPSHAALATALRRVNDPDENGVELYCDKPKEKWARTCGRKIGDVDALAGLARVVARGARGKGHAEWAPGFVIRS